MSALNEILAIKNDLRILQDRTGNRLKEYSVTVENDELIITDENGALFEYNHLNKESQRVQETIFHEKQTIIESCLFGVDINPNSVKICRLRLWIELLKHAYYKNQNELETLPNIDINIKCGNSLISRFDIDADLKQALKSSKWDIHSYRLAVSTYRNAKSKEEKREMERLINDIKSDFRTEINKNSKEVKKLFKLEKEQYEKFVAPQLFGHTLTPKQKKKLEEEHKKINEKIEKAKAEIAEIENNKIYINAFEWRFEFPEVLDKTTGDYIGFDIVIGNPPYGVKIKEVETNYLRYQYNTIIGHVEIYYLFIELALTRLLKQRNYLSFIIPNAWLSNKYAKGVRELILTNYTPIQFINFNKKIIFPDAKVETSILLCKKNTINEKEIYVGQDINQLYSFDYNVWLVDKNYIINFSENPLIHAIISKLNNSKYILDDLLDITNGCKPYQAGYGINLNGDKLTGTDVKNRIYHSSEKVNKYYLEELKGKHLGRYFRIDSNQFINWGKWLMSPKEEKYFSNPRILIRQIIDNRGFICSFEDQYNVADQSLYVAINYKDKDLSLFEFLAILNSKLYGFYFRKYYSEEDDLFPKIKVNELKRLPYKEVPESVSKKLEIIVNQILAAKKANPEADTQVLEDEIDYLVYKLYDLTYDEVLIVDPETRIGREVYGG